MIFIIECFTVILFFFFVSIQREETTHVVNNGLTTVFNSGESILITCPVKFQVKVCINLFSKFVSGICCCKQSRFYNLVTIFICTHIQGSGTYIYAVNNIFVNIRVTSLSPFIDIYIALSVIVVFAYRIIFYRLSKSISTTHCKTSVFCYFSAFCCFNVVGWIIDALLSGWWIDLIIIKCNISADIAIRSCLIEYTVICILIQRLCNLTILYQS